MEPARGTSAPALRLFKTWFWRPPRAHGDTIVDRRVSPLELLYDLAYVAVISQAGLHLAQHVSVAGVVAFALVFSLTWIAWTNGMLYLELHGRSDGRTRTFVFLLMGVLAILAVFARDAGDGSGAPFAQTYATFLAVMTWLWYAVRRRDITESPDFLGDTARFVWAIALSTAVMVASAFLGTTPRLWVWTLLVAAWVVLMLVTGRAPVGLGRGITPTDSLVERFGTFTIIVLGEVVFGVVDGLSVTEHSPWVLALLLVVVLGLVWAVAVRAFLLAGAWAESA
jgi:low temperature requirement protein LtrA